MESIVRPEDTRARKKASRQELRAARRKARDAWRDRGEVYLGPEGPGRGRRAARNEPKFRRLRPDGKGLPSGGMSSESKFSMPSQNARRKRARHRTVLAKMSRKRNR